MPRWIWLGVSLYFIGYYGRKAIVAETKTNGEEGFRAYLQQANRNGSIQRRTTHHGHSKTNRR
jgi:hypothetical protein